MSTSRSTWKKMERRIGRSIGGERNPLSGGASKHTRGDVIHDTFYVEVKLREDLSSFLNKEMREALEETRKNAKKEDKEWLIVFKEKYSKTNYALVDFELLRRLINEVEGEEDGTES